MKEFEHLGIKDKKVLVAQHKAYQRALKQDFESAAKYFESKRKNIFLLIFAFGIGAYTVAAVLKKVLRPAKDTANSSLLATEEQNPVLRKFKEELAAFILAVAKKELLCLLDKLRKQR